MKTIHIDAFNKSSVEKAISDLKAVKKEWKRKANLCSEMIAAALADEIEKNLDAIPYTDDIVDVKTHQTMPRRNPLSAVAMGNRVYIDGADVAFVEFGAGVYHNPGVNNPLSGAVNFDTSIGSFGQGHGNEPYWFIAHNLISRGTPAYMPIQNAIEAIKPQIPTMIRQVFL